MAALTHSDLMTLEAYSKYLKENKPKLIAHRRARTVHLGEHITLQFEDRETIQYQIQEMLRVEKIFEEDGIQHELESYVPLVPTGSNFKVTLQIEYADEARRREMLAKLKGVEDRVWVRVDGFDPVFAIADEDLERENVEKTSAVHFLRFELSAGMVAAAKSGAALAVGVDHPEYAFSTGPLPEPVCASLASDLR